MLLIHLSHLVRGISNFQTGSFSLKLFRAVGEVYKCVRELFRITVLFRAFFPEAGCVLIHFFLSVILYSRRRFGSKVAYWIKEARYKKSSQVEWFPFCGGDASAKSADFRRTTYIHTTVFPLWCCAWYVEISSQLYTGVRYEVRPCKRDFRRWNLHS